MQDSHVVDLKAAFVNAAYGKINSAMVRCTADVEGDLVHVQFVMRPGFNELDLDEARDIIGDMVGSSPTMRGQEELFELSVGQSLEEIPPRRILLYRISDRNLGQF